MCTCCRVGVFGECFVGFFGVDDSPIKSSDLGFCWIVLLGLSDECEVGLVGLWFHMWLWFLCGFSVFSCCVYRRVGGLGLWSF